MVSSPRFVKDPNIGTKIITGAGAINTSIPGAGTLDTNIFVVFTPGAYGSRFDQIIVTVAGTQAQSTANIARFYLSDAAGSVGSRVLFRAIAIPSVTPSASVPTSQVITEIVGGFYLKSDMRLLVAAQVVDSAANQLHIIVRGGDYSNE